MAVASGAASGAVRRRTPPKWGRMPGGSCAPPGIASFSYDRWNDRNAGVSIPAAGLCRRIPGRKGDAMRALITRPRENAGAIARALSERDIEPIQEPLLEIRATDHGPIDFEGIQ